MTETVNINPELIRMESLVENETLIEKLTDAQLNTLFNKLDVKVKKDSFAHAMKYNRVDTLRVEGVDEKLGFVRQAISVSHMSKSVGAEIFGTVKPWDSMIYSRLSDMGIQIPPSGEVKEAGQYAGGYVKAPIVGRHDWVISVDLTSLYPSIIRMLNMSPETLRRLKNSDAMKTMFEMLEMKWDTSEGKKNNFAIAANGTMYDKSFEGIIPATMTYLFEERNKAKGLMKVRKRELEKLYSEKEKIGKIPDSSLDTKIRKLEDEVSMLDAKQQALKILANSGYGAIGNSSFRYYKEDIAEGITLTGQLAIRFIANRINEHLNKVCNTLDYDYICAIDTDSVVADTKITINNKELTIAEFFECAEGNIEKRSDTNLIKHISGLGYSTHTYENGNIVEKPVNYIMAHKVKKKHYKITLNDKNGNTHIIQCTADHSLTVEREGLVIALKPCELKHSDIFILNL